MDHLHFQADGIAHIQENEIKVDFSGMPLCQLVALRRLGIGMSVKSCDNWLEAATAAATALRSYLDENLDPLVFVENNSFTIGVTIDGDANTIYQDVVNFFAHEHITVNKPSGIRSLTSA